MVLLALGLSLPSWFAEFYCDDQGMVLSIDGTLPMPSPGPFHLYTFMSGAPGERDFQVAHSEVPWWTVDGIKISFFRPLSSALLTLDHALSGRHPLPYHLHSVAWYVAAAALAALFFRRVLPERAAALAALLFVVSPAHWMLAAWPSARHVAISGTLAIAALSLHLAWRTRVRRGVPWHLLGALSCATLALLGGETALGLFGYVLAYECWGRREPFAERLRALVPWAALLLAYALIYQRLHFGVHGAGGYVDPLAHPGAYFRQLPTRFAVYLSAALLCLPSELTMLTPRAVAPLVALGVAAAFCFTLLLRRRLASLEPEQARTVRWLMWGAAVSLLPGIASIPGDRVLFLPNLGMMPALSLVLLTELRAVSGALSKALWRVGVGCFGFVHLLFAPLSFAFGSYNLNVSSHAALAAAANAQIPARPGVSVAGIGLSDPLIGMYLGPALYLAPRPAPPPSALHLLSMSAHAHELRRTGDRSLEIRILDGALLEDALETLFRPPDSAPLRSGEVVSLAAWSVRVIDESGGRPTRFSVLFDRSLDDPSLVLLIWKGGALRALRPPSLGARVRIEHEPGPIGF